MTQATANPEQQSARQGNRPMQTQAARTYQKVKLTETTEDELLVTYAPVISQMVYRFAPLARVTVDADDLKNIASLSLIQAAHGFDPTAGMSFESTPECESAGPSWMKFENPSHFRDPCIPAERKWRTPLNLCELNSIANLKKRR